MNEQTLFILFAIVLIFYYMIFKILSDQFISSHFLQPLGECASQEDQKNPPDLYLCLSLDQPARFSYWELSCLHPSACHWAPGGTSGYGMFWRQLAQRREEGGEVGVYFHRGWSPKWRSNYSSPFLSLCLWIKQMYVSSCGREGPWICGREGPYSPPKLVGAESAVEVPLCSTKGGYIFGYILILAGISHSLGDSSIWLTK